MRKKIVVFGSGDIAQLAHYYFTTDSEYDVVAFTVDQEYIKESQFCGVPVFPFESIVQYYDPCTFDMFIALSYSKLNALRKEKFYAAKKMGYNLVSYISSHATVLNNGAIGENCFILEDNTIQPFVEIRNNVTLWSGNHIGHHSIILDHTFISSHVVISGGVKIGEQCFIGVNSTLRDHITVGDRSVIGAGTLILSSVADDGLYIGSGTLRLDKSSKELKKI